MGYRGNCNFTREHGQPQKETIALFIFHSIFEQIIEQATKGHVDFSRLLKKQFWKGENSWVIYSDISNCSLFRACLNPYTVTHQRLT